jgi:aspartate/methionine/tyrosine aminotransferase
VTTLEAVSLIEPDVRRSGRQVNKMKLNQLLEEWDLGETMIRRMTRLANESSAVNLSQGFADYDTPEEVKAAAIAAIASGNNQYSYTYGIPDLRRAIAEKAMHFNHIPNVDPEDVVVTLGATEGITSALKTVANPGDEVIFFEPFHEAYVPQCLHLGLTPRVVSIDAATLSYNPAALEEIISERTVAILLNTPHNPTGKVFTRSELEHIAGLAREHDLLVITDEIYEHIIYGGKEHVSLAALEGMQERTFTTNSISKTYTATGWRVGWTICPPQYTRYVRAVHDISVVQAPTPLQIAAAVALSMPDQYYGALPAFYEERRELLIAGLRAAGFTCRAPDGSYYVPANFEALDPRASSYDFAMRLLSDAKVAGVPGSNFYLTPDLGEHEIRFAFCKRIETLEAAVRNLQAFWARNAGAR